MSQGRNKEGIWYIRSTQGIDACSSCVHEFIKSVRRVTICFQYVSFLHKEYQHDWNELFHLPIRWAESVGTEAGAQGILELVYIHLNVITEMRKNCCLQYQHHQLICIHRGKAKRIWHSSGKSQSSYYPVTIFFLKSSYWQMQTLWELQNPIFQRMQNIEVYRNFIFDLMLNGGCSKENAIYIN